MPLRSETSHYRLVPSSLGNIGVVWHIGAGVPLIVQILLPSSDRSTAERIRAHHPAAVEEPDNDPGKMCEEIETALAGNRIDFSLSNVSLDRCRGFQQRVLRETMCIPRGRVTSYGELAHAISAPGAARAVGTALARNPFPLVIPCHRVVRADGSIGRFGGGSEMKKTLLRLEGVIAEDGGKIPPAFFR